MSNIFNRRLFLRGAAGFTLALPFLPSLAEKKASAAPGDSPLRFVAFATEHGGVWQQNMYPGDSALTDQINYAGHAIRRGTLALDVQGSTATISPVLSADSSILTPALTQKLNVMRGLDVTFYLAHHRGGHLGNYAENDGNGVDGPVVPARPTIDQVLAWSDSFYPDLATIKERSLVIGANGMSAGHSSPSNHSGPIQNITPEQSSIVLFNKIFVPQEDPETARPLIVDRVLADYHRLRDSNRRLSTEDRRRLADHLDRLDELQRKLNVAASCGDVPMPTEDSTDLWGNSSFGIDPDAQARFWALINDVIVAAFTCDTARIVSCRVADNFSTFSGDWHQDIAHKAHMDPAGQQTLADAHQRFFEGVFVDLASKLDALDDGLGNTVLDSCIVQWTHECGAVTHDPIEMPVITAGGANGFLQTGQYVDYRNLNKQAAVPNSDPDNLNYVSSHIGLVYNQWLGTVLQAMGLPPSEYESGSYGGYGEVVLSTETWYGGYNQYDVELDVMSDVLPFVTG